MLNLWVYTLKDGVKKVAENLKQFEWDRLPFTSEMTAEDSSQIATYYLTQMFFHPGTFHERFMLYNRVFAVSESNDLISITDYSEIHMHKHQIKHIKTTNKYTFAIGADGKILVALAGDNSFIEIEMEGIAVGGDLDVTDMPDGNTFISID